MLKTIEAFMLDNNMITKGDRIVVGVSGGADSVCLFHVLLQLAPKYHLTLFVVHVNHGIRGEEADEDETYVKELCSKNDVSFTVKRVNVPEIASKEGLTEEEAGRKVRYDAFYNCLNDNLCNKVAIAHNRNDNAETMLFHLFRGSGIKGLTGIPATRDEIIRPLLCVSREEIENYLEGHRIRYQTDKTNLTEDYSRNKIRHRIINYARDEINSKAVEHMVNAAKQLKEIDQYLDKNINNAYERVVSYQEQEATYYIDVKCFKEEDLVIQKGIIRKIFELLALQLKDVESLHVNLILDLVHKEVGKSLDLPYGIIALKGYDVLLMRKGSNRHCEEKKLKKIPQETNNLAEHKLDIPGNCYIPETKQYLDAKFINYKKNMRIPQNGYTKWFDYDKIKNTVVIRTRNEGDYIQIDDKGSRKKIKSLFIDDKIPRMKRDLQPLLADGAHIMWVIGGRMSEAYKISEKTKVILEISLMEEK